MENSNPVTARNKALEEAADAAYLQCLKSGATKRRTKSLGLGRDTYDTEYAREVKASILALKDKPLPATRPKENG